MTVADLETLQSDTFKDVESVFLEDTLYEALPALNTGGSLGQIRESPENASMTNLLAHSNNDADTSAASPGTSDSKNTIASNMACGCSGHREYVYIDSRYFMTLDYLYTLLINQNTEIRTVFLKEKGCEGKENLIMFGYKFTNLL